MRLYSPIDSTGSVNMIEKSDLGETGTGDLSILSPTLWPLRHRDTQPPTAFMSGGKHLNLKSGSYWISCELFSIIPIPQNSPFRRLSFIQFQELVNMIKLWLVSLQLLMHYNIPFLLYADAAKICFAIIWCYIFVYLQCVLQKEFNAQDPDEEEYLEFDTIWKICSSLGERALTDSVLALEDSMVVGWETVIPFMVYHHRCRRFHHNRCCFHHRGRHHHHHFYLR